MPNDLDFDDPRPPTEDEWGTPLVEPRSDPDVEQKFRRRTGMVSGAVPYVAPHPWLYRPFLFLSDPTLVHFDEEFASAVSFIIARDNSCRFCYSAFRTLLRLSNFSPSDLQELETHFAAQDFRRGEEWGLRLAVRLSRADAVSEALDRLRALDYSKTAIREIAGISVLNLASNRIGTMLSIPVGTLEGMSDQWYLRPWRSVAVPLLRLMKTWHHGQPPLDAEKVTGPLAPWVRQLRGTPVGTIIQGLVARWLDTDRPLSPMTKLLMLGVVARGVAAHDLVAHLQSRLQHEHGLDATAIDDALNHLGGAALNDQTKSLLRLARASVRYDFGPIKRVAYDCTKELGRDSTLEAVASVSLANAIARLELIAHLNEPASD